MCDYKKVLYTKRDFLFFFWLLDLADIIRAYTGPFRYTYQIYLCLDIMLLNFMFSLSNTKCWCYQTPERMYYLLLVFSFIVAIDKSYNSNPHIRRDTFIVDRCIYIDAYEYAENSRKNERNCGTHSHDIFPFTPQIHCQMRYIDHLNG